MSHFGYSSLIFKTFLDSAKQQLETSEILRRSVYPDLALFEYLEYGYNMKGLPIENMPDQFLYDSSFDPYIFPAHCFHLIDVINFLCEISFSLTSDFYYRYDHEPFDVFETQANTAIKETIDTLEQRFQINSLHFAEIQPFRAIEVRDGMPFIRMPERFESLRLFEFDRGKYFATALAIILTKLTADRDSFEATKALHRNFGLGRALRILFGFRTENPLMIEEFNELAEEIECEFALVEKASGRNWSSF